eukprot:43033-Eustigmatos_ZCMA.PRE.1
MWYSGLTPWPLRVMLTTAAQQLSSTPTSAVEFMRFSSSFNPSCGGAKGEYSEIQGTEVSLHTDGITSVRT